MSGSSEEQKPQRRVRQRARRGAVPAEETAPKKTTRRRASAKSAATSRPRTKTKVSEKPVKEESAIKEGGGTSTEKRKAPTPFASSKVNQARIRKRNIVLGVVMLVGIGSSAAVGVTDSGQINVNETIQARNERLNNDSTVEPGVEDSVVSVPVQNTNSRLPNGGLVGRGSAAAPPPPPPPPVPEPVATSTATSSDAIATSTDESLEDAEAAEAAPEEGEEGEEIEEEATTPPAETEESVAPDEIDEEAI